jgi:hypothetical protein
MTLRTSGYLVTRQNRWKHFVDASVQVHLRMMKKLRFLVPLHTRENDFQVAQAQTAEETARKLESDIEIVFADNDAVNQSTQLLKAIQSRVESRPDAIVVEPFGGTAFPQVAPAASAAGIGWAILNRKPDYLSDLRKVATAPMFAVSSNHFEIGRIKEDNSQRCCREAVLFCTLKDLHRVRRPKNASPECWRRNRQTLK